MYVETHFVHDHATDLQDRHVSLLTLVSLPHYGAHSLQAGVGAVQPGNVTLRGGKVIYHNIYIIIDHIFTATSLPCSTMLLWFAGQKTSWLKTLVVSTAFNDSFSVKQDICLNIII